MDKTIQVALIGQPNVGKSALFSRLTGVGVISSNYPGTTVEFDEGTVIHNDVHIHVHDLPGTYSLSANTDDEKVVIDMLRDRENDVIIVVADSTNLESSLVLTIEVCELGVPVIVALNKHDLSEKRLSIDTDKLSKILGIPFISVSTRTGEGIDLLLEAISEGKAKVSDYQVLYDGHILHYIDRIREIDNSVTWGDAVKMMEGLDLILEKASPEVRECISEMNAEFTEIHKEPMNMHLARDRYGDAHIIAMEVTTASDYVPTRAERVSRLTMEPLTGIPILVAVLGLTFLCLIEVGGFLADIVDDLYSTYISSAIIDFARSLNNDLLFAIIQGIDSSIAAVLGLVIPYIMVFYIVLGILEDTGYLPRAVVLLDRVMHHFGLHGNGFIPIMVGFGCNVPAIMATRTIHSKRERIILCTLICMAVPCSAQLAIMSGVTGKFAGPQWVFIILAVLLVLGITVGLILNRVMKYEPSNLAIELPELQMPKLRNVFFKMWVRTKDFFILAVPLLIVGSIIIQILINYDVLNSLVEPMSWLTVGILGLPAVTIVAFIVGILRKEMAYGMLVVLAGSVPIEQFMTPQQFIVFGVVMSIYMPCLATITAMYRELGGKETLMVSLGSIMIAVLIGAAFNGILSVIM